MNSQSFLSWKFVREQFRLAPDLIHLAPMLFASHPLPVRRSIARFRRKMDRNPKYAHDELENNDRRVFISAANYLGCSPNEIALTDSTTMGLGIILTSMKLSDQDEILRSTHGHYSSDASIGFARERFAVSTPERSLYDPLSPNSTSTDEMVRRLLEGVSEKTRAVVITWVHSSTGVKIPVRDIYRAIQALNRTREESRRILLVVDAVHALGVEDFELRQTFCDFFIAGCHKSLCGPRGTGVIWANRETWKHVRRTIPPFGRDLITNWRNKTGDDDIAIGRVMTPGGYHSYEHRWALADAFDFSMAIGKRRIQRRLRRLASFCKHSLIRMPHVQLITPLSQELSSSIVCFQVDGWDAHHLEQELASQGVIASVNPYDEPCMRFSFGLYTSLRDVKSGLAAVEALSPLQSR